MSIVNAFDQVFLQPLLQLCGELFAWVNGLTGTPGWSLILLGVIVNAILLPLYIQMERSGRAQREVDAQIRGEVNRIKKHFSGREAYYYVQTTYRVHNYSPIRQVFRSFDLFVQMFVFSTMYRFLSDCEAIQGVCFGPIGDLASADGLVLGINILPLVMTGVNLLSVFAYDAAKRKQGIVLSLIFLFLLYSSPSGLVLYWISSNLFSWLRNLMSRWVSSRVPRVYVEWGRRWVNQA